MIHSVRRRRIGRAHVLEDVVIQFDTVRFLTSGCGEFGQSLEALGIARAGFIVAQFALLGRDPNVLISRTAIGAEAIVIVRGVRRGVRKRRDRSTRRVRTQEQVIGNCALEKVWVFRFSEMIVL